MACTYIRVEDESIAFAFDSLSVSLDPWLWLRRSRMAQKYERKESELQ